MDPSSLPNIIKLKCTGCFIRETTVAKEFEGEGFTIECISKCCGIPICSTRCRGRDTKCVFCGKFLEIFIVRKTQIRRKFSWNENIRLRSWASYYQCLFEYVSSLSKDPMILKLLSDEICLKIIPQIRPKWYEIRFLDISNWQVYKNIILRNTELCYLFDKYSRFIHTSQLLQKKDTGMLYPLCKRDNRKPFSFIRALITQLAKDAESAVIIWQRFLKNKI